MMVGVKTLNPHDDLAEGFEPSPLPPMGPDGAPQIPALRVIPPARPSLCHAGPCVHYHRIVIQVDAADPRAVKVPIRLPESAPGVESAPSGSVYRAPAAYHTQTHHYCYPDTGIEIDLGALPVVECNRWECQRPDRAALEHNRRVQEWEAARAAAAEEAAVIEQQIAESMAVALIHCQGCGREFEESALDITMRCRNCAAPPKEKR